MSTMDCPGQRPEIEENSKDSTSAVSQKRLAHDESNKGVETASKNTFVQSKKKKRRKRGPMYKDIEEMMFGFGDVSWPPNPDSVHLLEGVVTGYLANLATRAQDIAEIASTGSTAGLVSGANHTFRSSSDVYASTAGATTGSRASNTFSSRVTVSHAQLQQQSRGAEKLEKECMMYVVRKDRAKFSRIVTLLNANEQIKQAQKVKMAAPDDDEDAVEQGNQQPQSQPSR